MVHDRAIFTIADQ